MVSTAPEQSATSTVVLPLADDHVPSAGPHVLPHLLVASRFPGAAHDRRAGP